MGLNIEEIGQRRQHQNQVPVFHAKDLYSTDYHQEKALCEKQATQKEEE
jgi:hypothetical protein